MLGRLSASKRKDLKQLRKNKAFTTAFDALRVLPGLWGGFRIEHKFLSMKCDEVRGEALFLSNTNKTVGVIAQTCRYTAILDYDF